MAFLDDFLGSFTNQQAAPQQTIIPTNQLFGQAFGTLNSTVAPGILGFNQALAPGLTDVQLGVTNQLDPNILGNYRGANQAYLDQLNMGESLSPALSADITRKLLETGAATGFGASPGGIGRVALQTALEGEARGRQRRADAFSAGTTGMQISNQLYDPDLYSQLGLKQANMLAGDIRDVQAQQDNLANVTENIRRNNFSSIMNTGGRILGMIGGGFIGSALGNPVGGVQAGGAAGGSIFGGGVQGYGQNAIGGPNYGIGSQQNPFTSILTGLGSLFGGGTPSLESMRRTAYEQGGVS